MPVLEITTRIGCRVGCVYCPQEKLVRAYPVRTAATVMTFETFASCIDKLPREVDVHFTGYSEPWLNPECTRMLLYAHERGHRLHVSTTLVGMRVDDVDRIAGVPFKTFAIHLPSAQPYESIPVTEQYLAVLDRLIQGRIASAFHHHGEAVHPRLEHLRDSSSRRDVHDRAMNVRQDLAPFPKGRRPSIRRRGKLRCDRVRRNVLSPNGDVTLCCMDYGRRHVLGNLLESEYATLFEAPEFRRVVRGLRDERADVLCRSCTEAVDADLRAKVLNGILPRLRRRLFLLKDDPREFLRWASARLVAARHPAALRGGRHGRRRTA